MLIQFICRSTSEYPDRPLKFGELVTVSAATPALEISCRCQEPSRASFEFR